MRATVVVCTTSAVMAGAYQKIFVPACRRLGLNLQVCPGGSGDVICPDEDRACVDHAYVDIEEVFDYLSGLDNSTLAHTQVWLDLSSFGNFADAFHGRIGEVDDASGVTPESGDAESEILSSRRPMSAPHAPVGPSWIARKRGVWGPAARLLLGFPLVFPVLVHANSAPSLRYSFGPDKDEEPDELRRYLRNGFNFVSPAHGAHMLLRPLSYFANGHRCYFDPTGLRTAVKSIMLARAFGEESADGGTTILDQGPSAKGIGLLRERLTRDCVAVDEEFDHALVNAYMAWRKGYRAWIVTTHSALTEGEPQVADEQRERLIIRDIDLRFPDYPFGGARSERESLIDYGNWNHWGARCDATREIVVSAFANELRNKEAHKPNGRGNGNDRRSCGAKPVFIPKPIQYLHYPLGPKGFFGKHMDAQSLLERVEPALKLERQMDGEQRQKDHGPRHSAPYDNLTIAEALSARAGGAEESTSDALFAALLAQEAYELLLGMSRSAALEALGLLHLREIDAEVADIGIANSIDVRPRAREIEATVWSLLGDDQASERTQVAREFLLRVWGGIRVRLANSEYFEAAEDANRLVLSYLSWTSLKGNFSGRLRNWMDRFPCWRSQAGAQPSYQAGALPSYGMWHRAIKPPLFLAVFLAVLFLSAFLIFGRPGGLDTVLRLPWRFGVISLGGFLALILGHMFVCYLDEKQIDFTPKGMIRRFKFTVVLPYVLDVWGLIRAVFVVFISLTTAYLFIFFDYSEIPTGLQENGGGPTSQSITQSIATATPTATATAAATSTTKLTLTPDVCEFTESSNEFENLDNFVASSLRSESIWYTHWIIYRDTLIQVVLSTVQMGFAQGLLPIQTCFKNPHSADNSLDWVTLFHFVVSYIVLGVWVSLLFRKIARA